MNRIVMLDISFNFGGRNEVIYPVVLQDENDLMLIDCGYPNFLPLIEEAAKTKGIHMNTLTKILVTHHDADHMGSLADLKRKYPQVQILSSVEDEPFISGKKESLRLQQAKAIYSTLPEEEKEQARKFEQFLASIEHTEVDILLKDGDSFPWFGGIEIIATPGHMPGHISVYHKESKTLIAGDAVVVENGELAIANPQYTLDMEEAKKSIQKLLHYEIDQLICYHGGVYDKKIKDSLSKLF